MKHNYQNQPFAKSMRKNMTPWERKLWYCFLRDYPIRFQRQKCIDNYIVDFYCFQAKLVIELDGGGHYYPEQIKKDEERTRILESYGLTVLRFCNIDIDKNFYGVCTVIDNEVKNIRLAPPAPVCALEHPPHKCGGRGAKLGGVI